MFRATRTLFSALKYVALHHAPGNELTRRPIKASTGITGLEAHPDPLPALQKTYTSTLNLLSSLPSTSVYRQATEAITKHRLQTVESSGEDVAKFESALGSMAEVILEEAKAEQQLVGNMVEWKG
jgi:NADH dehydrogenase (ubiquinone) 1 alpha subcomplex subunit 5